MGGSRLKRGFIFGATGNGAVPLELATVSWSGIDADTVAWPDESLAGLVNTFFGEAVFESMLQDYVNGMMRDGAPVKVDNLGPHMIPETLGFFRAIEI